MRLRRRTLSRDPAPARTREGWETTPPGLMRTRIRGTEEALGGPALSEADTTTVTDPPPNPRRLTRLLTQKEEYETFRELIEVVGCIILLSD